MTGQAKMGEGARRQPRSVSALYSVEGLRYRHPGYDGFELRVDALSIMQGETVFFTGMSGSGKSTLIDLLAMLLNVGDADIFDIYLPDSGTGRRRRYDFMRLDDQARADLRRCHIGYVPQVGGLLGAFSIRRNILLPARMNRKVDEAHLEDVARSLGIHALLDKRPNQLSIGERQRVAVARAVIHHPAILIADEPTASVDPVNGERVLDLLHECAEDIGASLLLVTHDWDMAASKSGRKFRFAAHEEGPLVVSTLEEAA
jgi:putative ABC transport system ATP-binding protein